MKNGHAIVECKCVNEFQDSLYGKGKRVANATSKQDVNKAPMYVDVRCTVCSTTHRVKPNQVEN